jgi:GNAT superfamily N-acetyltransferase
MQHGEVVAKALSSVNLGFTIKWFHFAFSHQPNIFKIFGHMNLSIAIIEESDLKALRNLYLRVRRSNFLWLKDAALNSRSFDKDTAGEHILVAKIEDEVVGFVSGWLPDNFIHHLFIENSYQNKGIGRLLLTSMIAELNSPVTLKCIKRNSSAVRFYVRNGWLAKSEGVADEGEYILFEYSK